MPCPYGCHGQYVMPQQFQPCCHGYPATNTPGANMPGTHMPGAHMPGVHMPGAVNYAGASAAGAAAGAASGAASGAAAGAATGAAAGAVAGANFAGNMRPMAPAAMVMPMMGYTMGASPVSMVTQSLVYTAPVGPNAGIPIQITSYNPTGTIVGPVGPVTAPTNGYAPPMYMPVRLAP
ncbi:hypothetical protein B0T21DRAFT_280088 [Apiosordaria backusii]|uniref:Uncharacterized protein n=1 Tax=Apiosordaria backusii TaxID=314023 RepID=A0AA40ESU5_9PEZI|nr:hypothetical protein B0T21DRAFT_280088 [Apiosordaria backusii]